MEKINEIVQMLNDLINDNGIPKNIRKALSDAKQRLEGIEEKNVKISAAIYAIESISNDINMPAHARTQIWAVISELESEKTTN